MIKNKNMCFKILTVVAVLISCLLAVFVGVPYFNITEGYAMQKVLISLIVVIGVNVLFASLTRLLLPKNVNPYAKIFKVHKWETKLYLFLGVRKWKDKIPELGKLLVGFDKSKIANTHDNDLIMKFMQETIYAEVMHSLSAIFSITALFTDIKLCFLFSLPMVIASLIINVMPIIIQRYNRPKLMLLYDRNKRIEEKRKEESVKS